MALSRYSPETDIDDSLNINAAKAGLNKLEEYSGYMKENDTYWIASILDPRVKTAWLWKNSTNEANTIITRIKKYLRDSYPTEKKQMQEPILQEKSFESDFLRQYTSTEQILSYWSVFRYSVDITWKSKQRKERTDDNV